MLDKVERDEVGWLDKRLTELEDMDNPPFAQDIEYGRLVTRWYDLNLKDMGRPLSSIGS